MDKILSELSRLSHLPLEKIKSEMDLYEDLGLDSLDVTELVVFIEKNYGHAAVFENLRTVQDILSTAEGRKVFQPHAEIDRRTLKKWQGRRKPLGIKGDTLTEAFLRSCTERKDEAAAVDPETLMTYTRLLSLSIGMAEQLRKIPQKHIGVLLPSTTRWLALLFGLWLAKKVPVMLNWSLGPRHLKEVGQLADLRVVLSAQSFLKAIPFEVPLPVTFIDGLKISAAEKLKAVELSRLKYEELIDHFQLQDLSADDVAALLFTSGTEDLPKGVPLSHRNILSNQKSALSAITLDSSDSMLGILPPFHIFGFSLTHIFPILAGLRVILSPHLLDFKGHSTLLDRYEATLVCSTPTFLRLLLETASEEERKSVRLAIVGAEKAPGFLREKAPYLTILEGYGLTECSPILTLQKEESSLGVGPPIPGVEIGIIHPDSRMFLFSGEVGMVVAAGPNIFAGYLKNGKEPFFMHQDKRWFITGDLGKIEKGSLVLMGRQSRSLKIGGELICLSMIEHLLIDAFKDPKLLLALTFRENPLHHPQLILVTNQSLDLQTVNSLIRELGLSNLFHMHEIIHLEQFPLLPSGKIDYRKIDELSLKRPSP
ncbi:MAG: AMP-binding protein [Verrucomicrobia bacterium]|nr:AMP-binding protein [Verrucomicrobiota bacterium]